MYEYNVEFFPVKQKMIGEISDTFLKSCLFCDKEVVLNDENVKKYPQDFYDNFFYCKFCYRNNYHLNDNPIFIFSFKSVIYHWYENFYIKNNYKSIWLSQLNEMICLHKEMGLCNPCFNYDEENFYWFVDINKIGNDHNKVSLDEIKKTIIEMLICFNLWQLNIESSFLYNTIKKDLDLSIAEQKSAISLPTFGSNKVINSKMKKFNLNKLSHEI